MTTVRRITVSQINGEDANNNNTDEIRPFGETSFSLDENTNPNKLTLMMFDGQRTNIKSKVLSPGMLYGSNADSGDGNGLDTIKLIPDATLFSQGSDQYVIVDPTVGEPGHIHIRAGGTQDSSSADLYLGGELTCVRVSDTSDSVTIRTTNIGDPNITMDWNFQPDGNLYFPGIGTNSIGESEPGLVVSSDNSIVLQSNNAGVSNEWYFNADGNLILPQGGTITEGSSPTGVGNTITLTPNGGSATQSLLIYPTAIEGDHVHLTAGGGTTELYLGNDSQYVKLINGGNIGIRTDDLAGNSHSWTFGTDGSLSTPGNIIVNDTLFISGSIQPIGASPAPSLSGFSSISTVISGNPNEGNITAHNYLIANGGIITSGNITANYLIGNGSELTSVNAATVDILNTNGLGTTFYPTFVENRTDGQILRADVDLSYRTDTNTLTTNAISSSGNISASYFIGNGALLTGISAASNYGNSNVTALMSSFGSNTIATTGNITAGNLIGNISITGNVTGTSSNVSLVAGSFTATFDNTGILTLPANGGDEGGELNLGIPATNTTLTSRVVVDVYRDRFRIFDGTTKGVYVDLSQAATGVDTLLNNRVSGFANAGTFVTMDNIKATVTTGGNRGLSLATVSGTFTCDIGGTYASAGVGSSGMAGTATITTTASSSLFGWGFTNQGDIATYIITDTTNGRAYRITLQIGNGFNNNMISIERLI